MEIYGFAATFKPRLDYYCVMFCCQDFESSFLYRSLNQKLSSTIVELEEMKKRNELLSKDCDLFKTQRNHALAARHEAVNSRDKVMAEKDAIQSQYDDLLAKREQVNEERASVIQSYDSLHSR